MTDDAWANDGVLLNALTSLLSIAVLDSKAILRCASSEANLRTLLDLLHEILSATNDMVPGQLALRAVSAGLAVFLLESAARHPGDVSARSDDDDGTGAGMGSSFARNVLLLTQHPAGKQCDALLLVTDFLVRLLATLDTLVAQSDAGGGESLAIWEEVSEWWFLAMQALSKCVGLTAWQSALEEAFMRGDGQWVSGTLHRLVRWSAQQRPVDIQCRIAYYAVLSELCAAFPRSVGPLVKANGGMRVAHEYDMPKLADTLQSIS